MDDWVFSLVGAGGGQWVRPVALAAATGAQVASTTDRFVVFGNPYRCGRAETEVCFDGYLKGNDSQTEWQVRRDGEQLVVAPREDTPAQTDDLDGAYLFGDEMTFKGYADGHLTWERSWEDAGITVEEGEVLVTGSFAEATRKTFFASLFLARPLQDGRARVFPMEDQAVVALNAESGEVLWSRKATVSCGGTKEVLLLCTGNGSARLDAGATSLEFELEEASLVAVDLGTGAELWSQPVRSQDVAAQQGFRATPLDPNLVAVTIDGKRTVVEARSGRTVCDVGSLVFHCAETVPWSALSAGDPVERQSSLLNFPCSGDGSPYDPRSGADLGEGTLALKEHGLEVLTTPEGLYAYRMTD